MLIPEPHNDVFSLRYSLAGMSSAIAGAHEVNHPTVRIALGAIRRQLSDDRLTNHLVTVIDRFFPASWCLDPMTLTN